MAEPQVIISHSEHNDPAHNLAAPIAITIPGNDFAGQPMLLIKAIGGLTKLEHVSAMIIAANSRGWLWSEGISKDVSPEEIDEFNARCIDLAESAMRLCAKRQAMEIQR